MPIIPGYIIEEQKRREQQRRDREHPAQIPLYIPVPPPGWGEDGEREKPKDENGDDPYTISMI
jgi:hypothetical protein